MLGKSDKYITEKSQLLNFLNKRGIVLTKKNPPTLRCPNPAHVDEKPSAIYYAQGKTSTFPVVYCPVCAEPPWGIFEVAGLLDGVISFKDKLKAVRDTLGIADNARKSEPKKQLAKNFQAFPSEKKDEINTQIKKLAADKKWGKHAGAWKYHDASGEVIALDVRFEAEGERKNIITFWYDGKLKHWGAPVFIYNLYMVNTKNRIILIHEGAKCADIGNSYIEEFNNISWSGGSGKAHLADWSPLKNREVYIFPDNDLPGLKAAHKIREQLPHAKIIKSPTSGKNDDIEQALEKFSAAELTAYILDPENIESLEAAASDPPKNLPIEADATPLPQKAHNFDAAASSDSIPFKILGVGDDGRANFIDQWGFHHEERFGSLSKGVLNNIADLNYWREDFPNGRNGVAWDNAIDYIICLSKLKDFDKNILRGRGAWRDGEKISYHDGIKTYGEWKKGITYLRLPKKDIGIEDDPARPEIRKKIKEIVFKLSFETPADAVRCLAWSVLSPFAGALKYRPAMLITGDSGSGKSAVQSLIIKKLSNFLWVDATESSVAGIRGRVKRDSAVIFFEEAEKDTEKKKLNVADIFSLMRVNFTDDAPDTLKGTKEGGFVSYKMNSMFGFAAVDPTVESVADENRIFRINMVIPKNQNDWKLIEKELINLFSEKNCRAIRALTWQKLKTILGLSDKIVDAIRKKTGKDYRSSFADAMLASTFMVVWTDTPEPTDDQIDAMLNKYYSYQMPDEHRDEAEELINRLMDETIEILHEHSREKMTVMECLNKIYAETGKDDKGGLPDYDVVDYRDHLARYGIRLVDDACIAIANKHHLIKRIIGRGNGYSKILRRHHSLVESQRSVYFYDGKPRRCTVLKGVVKKREEDRNDEENLEALFE